MRTVCLLYFSACALADHYATLGVPSNATTNEIKLAYRALAKRLHPDKNRGPDAERKFITLKDAYELLIDTEMRQKYDSRLRYDEPRGSWIDWENIEAKPQNSIAHYSDVGKLLSNHEFVLIHVFYEEKHFFGGWMSLLPRNFALTHVNVLQVEDLVVEKLHITRYPCLMLLSTHFGRHGRAEIVPRRKEKNIVEVIEREAAEQVLDYDKLVRAVPFTRDAVHTFLHMHSPSDNGCIRLLAARPSRLISLWALARHFPQICVGQVFSSTGFPELDLELNSAVLSHPLGLSAKIALDNKALTTTVQRFLDRWLHEAQLPLLTEGRHVVLQSTSVGMDNLKGCITAFENFCHIVRAVAKCWWLRGYVADLNDASSRCNHRVVLVTNSTMAIYPFHDFDTRQLLRWVQTASPSATVDLLFAPPEVPSVEKCTNALTAHPTCNPNASYALWHKSCRGGQCAHDDVGSLLSLFYPTVSHCVWLVWHKWVAIAAVLCGGVVVFYASQSRWELCKSATTHCTRLVRSGSDIKSLQSDVSMAFRVRLRPSPEDPSHSWGMDVSLKATATRAGKCCEVITVAADSAVGGWNRQQPELWRIRSGDRITCINNITDPLHILASLQQPPGRNGCVLTVVRPQRHEFNDAVRVISTQVLPISAKFELFHACDGSNTRETANHRRLLHLHVPPTARAENARATFLEWRTARHWRLVRARVQCERGASCRAWGFEWCINACGLIEVVTVCVEDGFGVARGDVVVSCNHERKIRTIADELERCSTVTLIVERWERRNDDKFSFETVNVSNIYDARDEALPLTVWV